MCTLYTYKLADWEVRNLLEHRTLIGTNYPPTEVFPDYEGPVIVQREDGQRTRELSLPPSSTTTSPLPL